MSTLESAQEYQEDRWTDGHPILMDAHGTFPHVAETFGWLCGTGRQTVEKSLENKPWVLYCLSFESFWRSTGVLPSLSV